MKLIRLATSETVSLEDGFLWSDEFEWKPKEQTVERAISGAAIIQEGTKVGARPITLTPDSNRGWAKLSDVRKLQEWSALSEKFRLQFEWPHDNRQFDVIFNHQDTALEAVSVWGSPATSSDEMMRLTLRFWSE